MYKNITDLLEQVTKAKDQSSRVKHLKEISTEVTEIAQKGDLLQKKKILTTLKEAQIKYKGLASMQRFIGAFYDEFRRCCHFKDNATAEEQAVKEVAFATGEKITIYTNHSRDVDSLMTAIKSVRNDSLHKGVVFSCKKLTAISVWKDGIIIEGKDASTVMKEIANNKFMSAELAESINEFLNVGKKEEATVTVQQSPERRDSNKENETSNLTDTEMYDYLRKESNVNTPRPVLVH